jgi:hypothetical protein
MEATSVPASLDLPAILALAAPDMAAVDALIRHRLGSDVVLVNQVAEHIVSGGGKRLRPMLLLLAARALGHEGPDARQLAAVVEFIHTAAAARPPMPCSAMPPACWSATSCTRAASS